MATAITLAEKFQPILDEIYKVASKTGKMDGKTKPVSFAGANVVKVFLTDVIGLGTYNRADGYPKGQVVGTWETLTLATERGREISVDAMDDEESLGMAFGTLVSEFMRTEVVPEIDAYRFAKYSSWGGIDTVAGADLSAATVLAAIDAGSASMDDNEVPEEGRILYVSTPVNKFIEGAVTRTLGNEPTVDRRLKMLDGMEIIKVPQSRFYTTCTLDAGAAVDAGGFANAGSAINFMIIHPSAVLQVKKHAPLKIFAPAVNQSLDAWKFQYRIYHDAFVYESKVDGVYLHKAA